MCGTAWDRLRVCIHDKVLRVSHGLRKRVHSASPDAWYSITSAASALRRWAAALIRSRSRACTAARARCRKNSRSTRSMKADRDCLDPAKRSMAVKTSPESVIEVFSFILPLYYHELINCHSEPASAGEGSAVLSVAKKHSPSAPEKLADAVEFQRQYGGEAREIAVGGENLPAAAKGGRAD